MSRKNQSKTDNDSVEHDTKPLLIIVMGVSGCGKSTVAQNLAQEKKLIFLEADEFHSSTAKESMANGIPLNDAMREPWINSICERLNEMKQKNFSGVLAFSGLKKKHRQQFRVLGFRTLFLFLSASKVSIAQRLDNRAGHFFHKKLLASQFDALEVPSGESDVVLIDVECSLLEVNNRVRDAVNSKM